MSTCRLAIWCGVFAEVVVCCMATFTDLFTIFVASWMWTSTNDMWDALEKISDVSAIKVRLFKSVRPVTGWCPVCFFRLDHWMGSQKVVQITSGPTVRPNDAQ